MELRNYMEVLVFYALDSVLAQHPDVCSCDLCKKDIAAVALNMLPPKYVVTHTGEVYSKASVLQAQSNSDVISAIVQGIIKVSKNPRCQAPND